MILKPINIILVTVVSFLTLYLIEGACYRLVESYAKWRLNLSWGSPDLAKENSILKKIPLDHFALPPNPASLSTLDQELAYARKVMSFNRPMRDRYFNYTSRQVNPLRSYEIVDLESLKEVVLPGMRKPANLIDVDLGLARRQGLPVGYSKGIFVYLMKPGSRSSYENKFARLESVFSFLLSHGVACTLINPRSPEELLAKLTFLKAKYPNFSEKIFLYTEGEAAKMIDHTIRNNNEILTCLIVKDPSDQIYFENTTPCWFMGILSKGEKDAEVLESMQERTRLNRGSFNPYQSRMSGLLVQESEIEDLPVSSNAIAYILNCMEFFRMPDLVVNDVLLNTDLNVSSKSNLLGRLDGNISDAYSRILFEETEPNFECEVVNEYRQLNASDPTISNVSNRELVLQIGESFEEMGQEVLLQIAERDPLFYRFYLSLKEIHKSQN